MGLPLFDQTPQAVTAPLPTREQRIRDAFAHADERFKSEYRAFVLRYAERHETFIAEQAQMAYKDNRHLPQPRDFRSSGQIFRSLVKEGLLERCGFDQSKNRGVPMFLYRKV